MAVEFEAVLSQKRKSSVWQKSYRMLRRYGYYASLRRILIRNGSTSGCWMKALKPSMKETDSSIKVR